MAIILKKHKNDLFQLVSDRGFETEDFNWKITPSNETLTFRDSPYFFDFGFSRSKKWTLTFSPGRHYPIDTQAYGYFDWGYITSDFSAWLLYLSYELESKDLWTTTKKTLLTETSLRYTEKDEKFTSREQKQVVKALKDIKKFIISNHKFNKTQLKQISEKFEMLERESKTLGKQPWIHTLVGVLFGIAINAVFDPEKAHQLFDFAYNCLRSVLETPLLLK